MSAAGGSVWKITARAIKRYVMMITPMPARMARLSMPGEMGRRRLAPLPSIGVKSVANSGLSSDIVFQILFYYLIIRLVGF
jgi:hypothetical protein